MTTVPATLFSLAAVALALGAAAAPKEDVEIPPLRDSRIFAIDFGNSTTTLASLSAWSSLIAIKAKIAVAVAIFWAIASLFHKYIGSVSLCRSSSGYLHGDHHSIGDLYGSAALSHSYQESPHSSYASYSTPISGRPGRVEMEEETSSSRLLKEMVTLTKERIALADVVFGAINDDDCRRRLLCWVFSAYSNVFGTPSSASSDYDGGGHPFSFGDEECLKGSEHGGCPSSRLSLALSALTKESLPPNFDA
ncbi:uncharacterized protein [Hetaerina americana]|uniref:uncharacterized protein n=1 Tax=Hetaerina americana TaxID=62018 RepID=UPI003A7F235B